MWSVIIMSSVSHMLRKINCRSSNLISSLKKSYAMTLASHKYHNYIWFGPYVQGSLGTQILLRFKTNMATPTILIGNLLKHFQLRQWVSHSSAFYILACIYFLFTLACCSVNTEGTVDLILVILVMTVTRRFKTPPKKGNRIQNRNLTYALFCINPRILSFAPIGHHWNNKISSLSGGFVIA